MAASSLCVRVLCVPRVARAEGSGYITKLGMTLEEQKLQNATFFDDYLQILRARLGDTQNLRDTSPLPWTLPESNVRLRVVS